MKTILQIDTVIAIVLTLAIMQYVYLKYKNKKAKREHIANYKEKSVIDIGREQFKNLISKQIIPPVIMYK